MKSSPKLSPNNKLELAKDTKTWLWLWNVAYIRSHCIEKNLVEYLSANIASALAPVFNFGNLQPPESLWYSTRTVDTLQEY